MRIAPVLAFGLTLLLLPGLANGQTDAFYEQGGVEYYMAVGELGTGNVTDGLSHDGSARLPFAGCAVAKLRPDNDNGRIRVLGTIGDAPVEVDVNRFAAAREDMQGGIARDLPVDGSRTHDGIQHPAVPADLAAWGTARLSVQDRPYADPATGAGQYRASYFVTDRGFRDDATGRIVNPDGSPYAPGDAAVRTQGDVEMHLRLESTGNGTADPDVTEVSRPESEGFVPSYLPPTQEYAHAFAVENTRFGGNGTFEVETSSIAQAGENELTFTLRQPGGAAVAEVQARPSLGVPLSESVPFALDRFGDYLVEVRGQVSMAEYTVRITQEPADSFDLDFWWEGVTGGSHAPAAQQACEEELYGAGGPSGFIADPPPPPGFPWVPVVLTLLGATCTLLVAVKLTMMARAAAAHRRLVRD